MSSISFAISLRLSNTNQLSIPYVHLQCFDTVGWVFWPIKPIPIWPIMCLVGR